MNDIKLIQEKNEPNYQAAYLCEDKLVKTVKIDCSDSWGRVSSVLQIQTLGLDARLEELVFNSGLPNSYSSASIHGSSMSPFLNEENSKKCLEKFGQEFFIIFETYPDLKQYLPNRFESLIPYLK